MAKIILPQSALDTNENLQKLAMSALMKGAKNEATGDNVIYSVSNDKLSLEHAGFIIQSGGQVVEFPVFIKVDLDTEVSAGVPFADNEDEEGNTTRMTWNEWRRGNTASELSDGNTYIGANPTGVDIDFKDLMVIYPDIISISRFKSLQINDTE